MERGQRGGQLRHSLQIRSLMDTLSSLNREWEIRGAQLKMIVAYLVKKRRCYMWHKASMLRAQLSVRKENLAHLSNFFPKSELFLLKKKKNIFKCVACVWLHYSQSCDVDFHRPNKGSKMKKGKHKQGLQSRKGVLTQMKLEEKRTAVSTFHCWNCLLYSIIWIKIDTSCDPYRSYSKYYDCNIK